MQVIQPEVLIHWDAAIRIESILRRSSILIGNAIASGVLVYCRLIEYGRVLEHRREDGVGVEKEDGGISICTCKTSRHRGQVVVVVCDVEALEGHCFSAVLCGRRGMIDGWNIQEEKVARADGV